MEARLMAEKIARTLYNKKAQDIIILDVRHLTVITDYMVIASGRNFLQTKALADDVDDVLAEAGVALRSREGKDEGKWIVLDYGSVLVHVFHPEDREYYHLERLWDDGKNRIELDFEDGPKDQQ
ncbi:MAG: ribosome silencing factor [Clostridia bacterium]|nr:ribosome silencing factor [Clostridia bacterium]